MIEETKQAIDALPDNGRLFIDAGGRGEVRTGLTTAQIKKLNDDHTRLVEAKRSEADVVKQYRKLVNKRVSELVRANGNKYHPQMWQIAMGQIRHEYYGEESK